MSYIERREVLGATSTLFILHGFHMVQGGGLLCVLSVEMIGGGFFSTVVDAFLVERCVLPVRGD